MIITVVFPDSLIWFMSKVINFKLLTSLRNYCMSKKSWYNFYSKLLNEMCQRLLAQTVVSPVSYPNYDCTVYKTFLLICIRNEIESKNETMVNKYPCFTNQYKTGHNIWDAVLSQEIFKAENSGLKEKSPPPLPYTNLSTTSNANISCSSV